MSTSPRGLLIRPAVPDEAPLISRLARRSKAHWGYSPEQMRVFEVELTFVEKDVADHGIHVLEEDGEIAGFYSIIRHSDEIIELEHLFVEPVRMRRGHGTRLFEHAKLLAAQSGYSTMTIQADPNAEHFYEALGFSAVRGTPSSIPGRFIPYFEVALRDTDR